MKEKKIKEEITTSNSGVIPDEVPKEMNGIVGDKSFNTMLKLKNKRLVKKFLNNDKEEDSKKGDILKKLEKMLDCIEPPLIRQKEARKSMEEIKAPEKKEMIEEDKLTPEEVFAYVPIEDFIKKNKNEKQILAYINKALLEVKRTLGVNVTYSESLLIKAIKKKINEME